MHELAVTQEVLNIALEKAKETNARKITRINLVIGEMSGLVDDSVQFYFDFISNDSIASDAELSFRRIPAKARCLKCGFSFSPGKILSSCPQCQAWNVEVTDGRDFYIDSIEVD